jgi:sulfonate transport system substrate-binding protein
MRLRLAALSAVCILFLGASAQAEVVLRIGAQKGDAPRAALEAAGELNGVSYRIEWREFSAAAPLLEALNAGAIDAGGLGDGPFTFAAAAGAPVRAIAAVRTKPEGLAILVSKDSKINSFADLVGKTVGTGRGSIGHLLILAHLRKAGLKQDAVAIRFMQPAEANSALFTGAIDGWSTWEPYTSQLELQQGARRIATGVGLTAGTTYFVAHPDAIATKRAALQDFVGRLARARTWSNEHYEAYADVWSKLVGLPKEVALQYFKRQDARPVRLDDAVAADQQNTISLYESAGLITPGLEADKILDRSFNHAALPERPRSQ